MCGARKRAQCAAPFSQMAALPLQLPAMVLSNLKAWVANTLSADDLDRIEFSLVTSYFSDRF